MAVTSPAAIRSPNQTPNNRPAMAPNVANVVLGNLHIKPWYPSFYPEDTIGGRKAEWLYVCQWCFKYTEAIMKFSAHCKRCEAQHEPPPGDVIYEDPAGGYSIHQLDGEEHKLYAQNLSLFAKLFLETKSVFFDASTFLYYTLVLHSTDIPHGQVVGFFSKEKMSWDNNNVACILVFPPWMRRGLGQVLIAASYELGKREGRFGGPEKPLSTLGRKGYVAFWSGEIVRYMLNTAPTKRTVSVKDISEKTWILQEDLVAALKEMDVVEKRKTASGNVVLNKAKVRAWAERSRVEMAPVIDVEAFAEEGSYEEDLPDGDEQEEVEESE